ncbi:MAG: tetratricopeptide repeat protein [Candidatus Krumholzibacteriia bacterium]
MRTHRGRALATLGIVAICTVATSWARVDVEKAHLRNELGVIYVKDGHLDDGLRYFSLVLVEFPDNAAALNNTANVYFLQGETERARGLYERAIQARPDEGGIHLNLGILLHALGEDSASAAHARRGLELIGDPQQAYYMLGLSSKRPDPNRGSDEADLQEAEIEELLARAMAQIPVLSEDSTRADGAVDTDEAKPAERGVDEVPAARRRMSPRPGGAKAAQARAEVDADRLFWMTLSTTR